MSTERTGSHARRRGGRVPETGKTVADIVESLRRWLLLQRDAQQARWTLEIKDSSHAYTITHSEELSGEFVLEGEVVP